MKIYNFVTTIQEMRRPIDTMTMCATLKYFVQSNYQVMQYSNQKVKSLTNVSPIQSALELITIPESHTTLDTSATRRSTLIRPPLYWNHTSCAAKLHM